MPLNLGIYLSLEAMKRPGRIITCLVLLLICYLIHWYSTDKGRVESGYSSHFFVQFSHFQRMLFGNIPFSVGDILYGATIAWLLWKGIKLANALFSRKKKAGRQGLYRFIFRLFCLICILYISFNVCWGINYNRKGIASQLGLDMKEYSLEDLKHMNELLLGMVNLSKQALLHRNEPYPANKELFTMVANAYGKLAIQYPFLEYKYPSLKSSLWGWLGNYTGFTGYYDPFTGEAQVNTTVPKFTQPFTACHEVAHQLGYAKEMEANFVGYLAASGSKDTLFHYAVYLDLFTYANRDLYFADSAASRTYRKLLSPAVIGDLKEWADFNARHRNPAEPLISWLYGQFLRQNQQPMGIRSYDKVTAFLIAYYRKFGRI